MLDLFSGFFGLAALGAMVMGIIGLAMMKGDPQWDMLVAFDEGDAIAWHTALTAHKGYAVITDTTAVDIGAVVAGGTLARVTGSRQNLAALHAEYLALPLATRQRLYVSAPMRQDLNAVRVRPMVWDTTSLTVILDTGVLDTGAAAADIPDAITGGVQATVAYSANGQLVSGAAGAPGLVVADNAYHGSVVVLTTAAQAAAPAGAGNFTEVTVDGTISCRVTYTLDGAAEATTVLRNDPISLIYVSDEGA